MKWTSHLAQRWTKIPGAQHTQTLKETKTLYLNLKWRMTKCSKKVSMKWTSLLAQGWTKIPGAQQDDHAESSFFRNPSYSLQTYKD